MDSTNPPDLDVKVSGPIDALAAAVAQAQHEINAVKKTGKNPHFRSTFATLEGVLHAIREPLQKHGLAVLQFPVFHPAGYGLTTILTHASGQWLMGTMVVPVQEVGRGRNLAQEVGSTTTYMRRYALTALLGVPVEDDDGNAAGPQRESSGASQPASRSAGTDPRHDSRAASEKQLKAIYAKCRALNLDEHEGKALLPEGVATTKELSKAQAGVILDRLTEMEQEAADVPY